MTDAVLATNLGWPRMGPNRELKRALERHWSGRLDDEGLLEAATGLRQANLLRQWELGLDVVPTGDFTLYDHVLDTAVLVGAVSDEVVGGGGIIDLPAYFDLARGASALEMTKWFDTNYHYLVPELHPGQRFRKTNSGPADAFREATALGVAGRPVLLGPLSFLLLAKLRGSNHDPLELLPSLLDVYEEVLVELAEAGADWVQIDEPTLVLDLDPEIRGAYRIAYQRLADVPVRLLLSTYFGELGANLPAVMGLPVEGLHVDCVRAPAQLEEVVRAAPRSLVVSLGVVDGRNVWRSDLPALLASLGRARDSLGPDRLLIAPSCSLLHLPVDLDADPDLDPEVRPWIAYATQRIEEVVTLTRALNGSDEEAALEASRSARAGRADSPWVTNTAVQARLAELDERQEPRRLPYSARKKVQDERLGLPVLPTTTIGSFPQTTDVRALRARRRRGELDDDGYTEALRNAVADAIRFQEKVGLDVLVHGEFERNDMVEYFGEHLAGCLVTANGWVQSYGSRCVKPPIIFGDVSRPEPMTVAWTSYAQSLTDRPVKGMLTGPVTILQWSFVRDDQAESITCRQIALAIRDEVADLEAAGTAVIQVDEPALREGVPLRIRDRAAYLDWAVGAFRLATSGAAAATQVHTHMCYGEFADVLDAIVAFDADVISIETARSKMELLGTFAGAGYPSGIGPGVWDIHSAAVPTEDDMTDLLTKATGVFSPGQLWVNPDCGLKTRSWEEVEPALVNLVAAAHRARAVFDG